MESGRRESRERALSLLYEAEMKAVPVAELLPTLPIDPDPFALDLVRGVAEKKADLEETLARHSTGWALDRMPVMDRLVLELAIFELTERPDIPTAVAISEAVELAKIYSTDDSGRFVNGVLAAVAREARPDAPT